GWTSRRCRRRIVRLGSSTRSRTTASSTTYLRSSPAASTPRRWSSARPRTATSTWLGWRSSWPPSAASRRGSARVLDVTAYLAPERASLLELLRGLSAEQWAQPTECPAWDVKGVALHILGDDLSLLSRQRDASTDGLTLFAVDHPGLSFRELLDGFNEL